jgi:hypothetical protein
MLNLVELHSLVVAWVFRTLFSQLVDIVLIHAFTRVRVTCRFYHCCWAAYVVALCRHYVLHDDVHVLPKHIVT